MSEESFESELINCLKVNGGALDFCKLPAVFKKNYEGREMLYRAKQLRKFIESIQTINIKQSKSAYIVTLPVSHLEATSRPADITSPIVLKKDSRMASHRISPKPVSTSQRDTPQIKISEIVESGSHPSPTEVEPTVYLLGKHHSRRSSGQNNLSHLLVDGVDISTGCGGLIGVIQDREDPGGEEDFTPTIKVSAEEGLTTKTSEADLESEVFEDSYDYDLVDIEENNAVVEKMKIMKVDEVKVEENKQEEKDYSNEESDLVEREHAVYIQTAAPFCAVCIGVQGAGKSHTMNVILENCMLPTYSNRREITTNIQPMTGLVLHYDQSESNVCEAVGLYQSNHILSSIEPSMKVQRMVVLVSPNYYHQRKAFYEGKCEVYPLLFNWSHLTAMHLRKLMRLAESDSQLYVSVMLNKLRTYQRNNEIPVFEEFVKDIQNECNASGQSAPLQQRLELLKNFMRDSELNKNLKGYSLDNTDILAPGTLVVADLTDPMLAADEACGVFQVLLEQFRCAQLKGVGKVITFDEAHKYLNHKGPGCIELTNSIIETIRMMRHEGIRVLLSTQSPTTMPPELLELASLTILHKFQSSEWVKYISSKVPLPEDGFNRIKSLAPGQALLISTHIGSNFNQNTNTNATENTKIKERKGQVNCLTVNIRPRLTQDLGASKYNTSSSTSSSGSSSIV